MLCPANNVKSKMKSRDGSTSKGCRDLALP